MGHHCGSWPGGTSFIHRRRLSPGPAKGQTPLTEPGWGCSGKGSSQSRACPAGAAWNPYRNPPGKLGAGGGIGDAAQEAASPRWPARDSILRAAPSERYPCQKKRSFPEPCAPLARVFIQIRATGKTNDRGAFEAFLLVKRHAQTSLAARTRCRCLTPPRAPNVHPLPLSRAPKSSRRRRISCHTHTHTRCCTGEESFGRSQVLSQSFLIFLRKTKLADSSEIPERGVSSNLFYTSTSCN